MESQCQQDVADQTLTFLYTVQVPFLQYRNKAPHTTQYTTKHGFSQSGTYILPLVTATTTESGVGLHVISLPRCKTLLKIEI